MIKVEIKGFDKLVKDINKLIDKSPEIVAKEYRKLIMDNLQPSKKTGALLNSWRITSRRRFAQMTSKLPYAAIQNYGGRIKITQKMRGKMWHLFKEFGLPVYKAIAITKKTHVTIPAKKYLDVNETKFNRNIDIKVSRITRLI